MGSVYALSSTAGEITASSVPAEEEKLSSSSSSVTFHVCQIGRSPSITKSLLVRQKSLQD